LVFGFKVSCIKDGKYMFQFNKGFMFVVLAAALWGTSGIVSKTLYSLSATNAFSIAFFRLGVAAPVFLLVALISQRQKLFQIPLPDVLLMAFTGAMVAASQLCYFASVSLAGVAIATLVTVCTSPILVLVLTVILGYEKLNSRLLTSLALAIFGTVLLVGVTGEIPKTVLQGVFLALGSALGYAAMTLVGRNVAGRYSPLQINSIVFTVGAILLLIVALANGLVLHYSVAGWGLVVYLGLIPSVLGYALFIKGMQTTSASVVSILTLIEPLTATLLAYFFFAESLSASAWVGALLVLSAIFVLSRKHQ
jgi:drug/metabolite transporter, DME family